MTDFKVGDRVRAVTGNKFDGALATVVRVHDESNIVEVRYDDEGLTSTGCGAFYSPNKNLVLLSPPTVGMSSKDLADAVEATIRETRSRVEGVGDQQYSTDKGQKFEGLKVSELLRMAREEAQDLVVYAVMTDIRLARIEAAIEREGL